MAYPELLIVLAGENPEKMQRTKRARDLYLELGTSRGERTPILVCGSHSGLLPKPGEKEQSWFKMRQYLINHGVKEENIIPERESMDTFANFALSRDLIPSDKKHLGIITEIYHQPRCLWSAKKVHGENKTFEQCPTEPDVLQGISGRAQEIVTYNLLRFDLRRIKPGDREAINEYMKTIHPFHSENSKFSLYGCLAKVGRRTGARER